MTYKQWLEKHGFVLRHGNEWHFGGEPSIMLRRQRNWGLDGKGEMVWLAFGLEGLVVHAKTPKQALERLQAVSHIIFVTTRAALWGKA